MRLFLAFLPAAAVLAACNSGKSSSGPSISVSSFPAEYRSVAYAVGSDEEVSVAGDAVAQEGTIDVFTGADSIVRIEAKAGSATQTFDTRDGDLIEIIPPLLVAETATGDAAGLFDASFEYQSYGFWVTGTFEPGSNGVVAVASAGERTPPAAVPVGGTASYSGAALGAYVDANGQAFATVASMDATVDFGAMDPLNVSFATSDTMVVHVITGVESPNSGLDLSGSGTLVGNGFSGSVTAVDDLAGDFSGRLYGPAAQEIGGTFALAGGAGRYIGAFGGAQ